MRTVICMVVALGCMALAQETTSREPVSCSEGQYPCQAGICIPDTWLCDGTTDCPNYADDEQQCPTSAYTQRQVPEGKVPEGEADARSRDAAAKIDCDGYLCYGTLACINITLVCNGEYNCLYGDDEGYCNYTKTTTTPIPPVCGDNFDYVYDRCVLIDLFTATTWDEARYLCQLLDGDLVVLDDFNFYEELVQYIQGKGLDEHSYWVGATDRALEGVWLWVNVAPVPSGAPLWALYGCTGGYDLEPNPTEAEGQDCAFLDKDRGLHMSDAACSDSLAAICQTTAN